MGWIYRVREGLLFLTFFTPGWVGAADLRLRIRNEEGQAVRLTKAEILLVAWGDTARLDLLPAGRSLTVKLDEAWLRSRWPERFSDMMKAYLYFQADGYAAVRSDPFLWLGSHGPPFGPPVTVCEIKFPRGKKITLRERDSAEMELVMRKPRPKTIRLVDDDGNPAVGIPVNSYMFWSDSNHCGHLSGADLLGRSKSDLQGRVVIADGDFEYAIELERGRYTLKSPGAVPILPPRLLTFLDSSETIVKLHRWVRRTLDLRLSRNGMPVPGQVLVGRLADCPCGACAGQIGGVSDSQGMIRIPEFYPEEWEYVFFENQRGQLIWKADPRQWPKDRTIEVDLRFSIR